MWIHLYPPIIIIITFLHGDGLQGDESNGNRFMCESELSFPQIATLFARLPPPPLSFCFSLFLLFSSSGSPSASTHTNPTCSLPQAASLSLYIHKWLFSFSAHTLTFTVCCSGLQHRYDSCTHKHSYKNDGGISVRNSDSVCIQRRHGADE